MIRRDDIIALLTLMNGDGAAEKKKAKQYRKRIFELLQSEVSLRGTRPFIEKFIDQKLLMRGQYCGGY